MPTDSRVRISAVVATVGRVDSLRSALTALLEANPAPFEIVVVDGDAERSAEPVARDLDGGRGQIVYLASERGLTRQRNRALGICRGDVVAFFDDDARVEPDVFGKLERIYEDPTVVGATGLVIEPASNRIGGKTSRVRRLLPGAGPEGEFTRYGYPNRVVHVDQPRDVENMQGCFMTARLDAARLVRFDEHLPGYGLAEDEDFSYRLSRRGRIAYLPDAVVHHDNQGFGSRDTRAFGRQVVANRAYLLEKNFAPTRSTWLQFGLLLGVLVVHRLTNGDLPGARGILEGAWRLRHRVRPTVDGDAPLAVTFVSSHAQLGGSERYLEQLLTHLGGAVEANVIVLDDGPFVPRLERLGCTPTVIRTGSSWSALIAGGWRLRGWLRRDRVRLVHANGVKAALVASLATIGTGTSVIWVKHDFSWDGPLARLIARRCRDVVGVSRAVLEGLPDGATHVVHTGIHVTPPDRQAARGRLTEQTGTDGPFVTLVGRLHPVKGHLDLLDAVPALARAHPTIRVVFVGGEDPTQPEHSDRIRRAVASPGLGDHVVLLGAVDDASAVIAASDVIVVASVPDDRGMGREGFGLVALEAMALGTPVVAYADGAVPEVVGPCARLVPPGDRAALAAAILAVLGDPATQDALTTCGRQRALGQFTIEQWVAQMLERYRAAIHP